MVVNLPEVLNPANMTPARVIHPSEEAVNLSILSVSSADIRVLIAEEIKLGDWVRLYYPNGKSGVFRAGNPVYDYDKDTMSVTVTHGCITLADSVVTEGYSKDKDGDYKEVYFEGTISTVLTKLLGYQKTKHWKLGTVEPTDQVKIEIKYQDILTLVNDAMDQVDDSYIEYDQKNYPWTINVRKNPTTVSSEGRLSRNVRSAKVSYDDTELITKLYCNELAEPLTSKNVSKYGVREGFFYVSGEDADWIARASKRYLKNREKPIVSINIDGADFSQITGVSIDKIVLADLYRLAIPKYSTVVEEQITELVYNDLISRPTECTITLGSHKNDLANVMARTATTAHGASTGVSVLGAREKDHWDRFLGEVDGLNTQITQTKELIRLQANDVENRLHAELSITANRIESRIASGWTGYESRITQTADQIRMEVQNRFFGLSSAITQTASNINLLVRDTREGLQSQINVNKDNIELKVSKGQVATRLTVEVGNVKIENGNLVVDGMVTAESVSAAFANIRSLTVPGKLTVNNLELDSGSTTKSVWSAVESIEVDPERSTGNTVCLKYTKFNTTEGYVSFSKAALLRGSWSGGVYTASPSARGSSTTATTTLAPGLVNSQYNAEETRYEGYIGYIEDGEYISTGKLVWVSAIEAFQAGQASVEIPTPTYSEAWASGTYTVKADGTAIKATTLNSATVGTVTYLSSVKWLSFPVSIGSSGGDTGYSPTINVDASEAYNAGWAGYHASNKWSIEAASTSATKKVYRPKADPAATTAEVWFKVRLNAEWGTKPGSSKIKDSNKFTYAAQRKIGDGSWGDMVENDVTISLAQSGDTVYAKAGSQNIAKLDVVASAPTMTTWFAGDGYALASGLAYANSSKIRLNIGVTVNGSAKSQIVTTNKAFSLGKNFKSGYVTLYYGSTAVAWLKAP